MREAPQGHRREPFLRNFLGEQKVPRRRQNARRAEKRGPQAQRKQRPEGEKARAAGPGKNPARREPFLRNFLGEQKVPRRRQNARRARKPGPQAQREPRPEGEEKHFQKKPGPHGP